MSVDIKKDNKFWDLMNLVPKQLLAPQPATPNFLLEGMGYGYDEWKREGIPKEFDGKEFEEILRAYFDWGGFLPVVTPDGSVVKAKQIPKSPALEKMREKYRYEQDKLAQHKKEHERLHKLAEEEKKADVKISSELRLAYLCTSGKKASALLTYVGEEEACKKFIQDNIDGFPFKRAVEWGAKRGYWLTPNNFKSEPFPHLEDGMIFKVMKQAWECIGTQWVYTVILMQTGG